MSRSGKKILLVEDNPAHAKLALFSIKGFLQDAQLEQALDGEEAIDKLKGMKEDLPDMVLLDLKLPKIDGVEVLRRIRKENKMKSIAIIMLTSSESEMDMEKAYEAGANGYIVKPVNFTDFNEMMKDACGYWLDCNRHAQ